MDGNCCICLVLSIIITACQSEPVTIPNYGQVIGVTRTIQSKGSYAVYYEIPYAKPPVGDLRFAKPQKLPPVEDWQNKKYPADQITKVCQQMPIEKQLVDFYDLTGNGSRTEDCLYLNVFVPLMDGKMPSQELPVMVFIHGGGFVIGSAVPYDAGPLAILGKAIIVTFNYRLGIFGFGQANRPDAPGNVGMLDQIMVFKWVKENIKHFKGDANSITAFGQSAGSMSISLHMISNLSRGLFNKAILQSGAPMTLMTVAGKSNANWMETVTLHLGCPIVSRNESKSMYANFTDETMKCLRSVPAEKLITLTNKLLQERKILFFLPDIDGEFLTDHPYNLLQNPAKVLDPTIKTIIAGLCAAEGNLATPIALPKSFPPFSQRPSNLTYNSLKTEIIGLMPQEKREKAGEFIDFVYDADDPEKQSNISEILNRVTQKISDFFFNCPVKYFIDAFLKVNKNKVFLYLLKYRSQISRKNFAPWEDKAIHADDLDFVFGKGFLQQKHFTDDENELSLKVINDWTTYARTGKINEEQWKACSESECHHYLYDLKQCKTVTGFVKNNCEEDYDPFIGNIINKNHYITDPSNIKMN